MLSRIAKVSLVRAFSLATPVVRSPEQSALAETSSLSQNSLARALAADLASQPDVVEIERKHLTYYINEIKEEVNDHLGINFETPKDGKTLILESIPDGTSTHKLG
uniref:Predicted protein n=1 Tax=Hordeum vulgare subsp. vulgare TaxID=112509 RepID=F2DJM8_HORVV|nr:predicted protein [Hordeum vulgare subsp. vulgare]